MYSRSLRVRCFLFPGIKFDMMDLLAATGQRKLVSAYNRYSEYERVMSTCERVKSRQPWETRN